MSKKRTISVNFDDLVCDQSFNSRTDYDNIDGLAESIKQTGLLQPIGVTEKKAEPGKYFIVYGFRRYAALAKIRSELGPEAFDTLDVILNDGTLEDLREKNLRENIDREQLKPHEIATAIKKMVNSGLEQRDIGSRLGRPQSWVSYHYKVATKLSPTAWTAFRESNLTLEQALHIADIPEEAQGDIVTKILGAETRTEARQIAKKASESAGSRRNYTNRGRPSVRNLAQYVNDASFDATTNIANKEDKNFYNGVAAGIRVALGDFDFAALEKNQNYLDADYVTKRKAASSDEDAAAPKKRGRPPKDKTATPSATPKKRGRPPKDKTATPSATPKKRGRPPKNA
jgi:ParB/RepB/Spo0J family partition protein